MKKSNMSDRQNRRKNSKVTVREVLGTETAGGKLLLLLILLITVGGGVGVFRLLRGETEKPIVSIESGEYPYRKTYGTGHFAGFYGERDEDGDTSGEDSFYVSPDYGGDPQTFTSDGNSADTDTGTDGNEGILNQNVSLITRGKYTEILGNGQDRCTVMIYMCGADLETLYGMASADLREIADAEIGTVNVIVFAGGTEQWKNAAVQGAGSRIFQVTDGGVRLLKEDSVFAEMGEAETLSDFIRWCGESFPANRNELIFWGRNGGIGDGFGGDRENSLSIAEMREALEDAGVLFDFIGFDAGLSASVETASALCPYADYLIASEGFETEEGWYYTDWITALAQNPAMATAELGKLIADDYIRVSSRTSPLLPVSMSVIDLAEYQSTVPGRLTSFAEDLKELLRQNEYRKIAEARSRTMELASGNRSDTIDLADFASNIGTSNAQELISGLKRTVEYSVTNHLVNVSGLSVWFPYHSPEKTESITAFYDETAFSPGYCEAVREFCRIEMSGRSEENTVLDAEDSEYGQSRTDRYLPQWTEDENGQYRMTLEKEEWETVRNLDRILVCFDGKGYYLLGTDNIYRFGSSGELIADTGTSWIGIGGQTAAYYHESTIDDGEIFRITGRIPCRVNEQRADLIVVFDTRHPEGEIAGVQIWRDENSDSTGKLVGSLREGDRIVLLAEYSEKLGEDTEMRQIGDIIVWDESVSLQQKEPEFQSIQVIYRFTDIYDLAYDSEPIDCRT